MLNPSFVVEHQLFVTTH